MKIGAVKSGTLPGGLRFVQLGAAGRPVVVFPGLADAAWDVASPAWDLPTHYRQLALEFTVFVISRKRGLPDGYTTRAMAADYATAIEHEIGPAAVMGISLGGLIAQHFAADFPQSVRQLVLACAAHRISDEGRQVPEHWLALAGQNRWREFYFDIAKVTLEEFHHTFYQFLFPLVRLQLPDPTDFLGCLAASLVHDGTEALGRIQAPTLVIGSTHDIFFPPALMQETVRRMPRATLHLIDGNSHGAYELQHAKFADAVLRFLHSVPTGGSRDLNAQIVSKA